MTSESRNPPRLLAVAHALRQLRDQVVFVGGATVNLYITAATSTPEPCTSDDVDCLVEFAPLRAFHRLEKELRVLGFVNEAQASF